jgi:acyl carrier protein
MAMGGETSSGEIKHDDCTSVVDDLIAEIFKGRMGKDSVDPASVTDGLNFKADLGADSLDLSKDDERLSEIETVGQLKAFLTEKLQGQSAE